LRVNWSAHVLIPYMPKTGIGLGLFALCQLIAWGLVGAISPFLRPETAISSAVIGGTALFAVLYAAGWFLVSTPAPHVMITSQDVQNFLESEGLQNRFTPQNYLPTMRLDGFSCSVYSDGSYVCSK
jgi:hypothetical protein